MTRCFALPAAGSILILPASFPAAAQPPAPPKPASGTITVAVSGVHDRNSNNKPDANFLGIPRGD